MSNPSSAQIAQTAEPAQSAGRDGADIRNVELCRPDAFSPKVVAAQSALGLGLGVAGFFLGYQMDRGGMGVGAGLGYMAGTTVGIWSLGKAVGGNGGYGLTVLGMMGGAVVGIFSAFLVREEAAPFVLLGALNLGALGGYHFSNGSFRARLECRESPGSGGKSSCLKVGADVVLARW